VQAFSVTAVGRGASLWKDSFEVRFSRVVPPLVPVAADRLQVFDRVVRDAATDAAAPVSACTASLDSINGRSPAPARLDAAGVLQVRGWAAASMAPPALPDAVLVVLTDEAGRRRFVQARRTPRPDVGAHFKSATLDGSGYAANLDLSGLRGRHTLGLAMRRADKIDLCPQPVATVEVGLASARAGPSIEPGSAVPAR
jgi:hypothetical protein